MKGCEKFISTSRTDRTNVDRNKRSQMDYVSMEMDANIQALKHILFEVKTMHPLGDKGIADKDMLKVNIKDNKETIENHIFDIL